MKHTPAPWRISRLYKTCVESGEDTLIAALETRGMISKPQGEYSIPGIKQQEANAQLISAAPDLLSALKCVQALDSRDRNAYKILENEGWRYSDRLDYPASEFVAKKVYSAINKAEGGNA